MNNYNDFYKKSISNPELFWEEQSKLLDWFNPPNTILGKNKYEYPLWYDGGKCNASYLCIDKHVNEGYGEQVAIVYDSPVTDTIQKVTYNELKDNVEKLAGGLVSLGLKKGDTCVIYMPMIPQAIYSMLACARIGVTHSVVFGGFAPNELAIRIDDCKPKVLLTASCGIEINKLIPYKPMVDEAIRIAKQKPQNVILFDRKIKVEIPKQKYDLDYNELVKKSSPANYVEVESNHPLYILYTSGTTGKPKGIVRDTGGYATAMLYSMKYVYDVKPGEVYWAASDVGWVVGHSYIVYAPLMNRNTTVLFEGKPIKTPDASTFWRVIEQHKVSVMFTAPTAIRAIKKEDPDGEFIKKQDLTGLRTQFLAGERTDVSTFQWLKQHIPIPVIDHWWQTESGWPMIANMMGVEYLDVKPGSCAKPVAGYYIKILNENGKELPPNEEGYVAVKLPLPPGTMLDLWKDHDRFIESYLSMIPGYYLSGDGGYKDEDGYIFITGRIDDVINVAGHRLSTADMEEIVARHISVAECAVIGIEDELKGQIPLALFVSKADTNIENTSAEIIQMVRDGIGAIASLKKVIEVKRLPKTRSGKILRKLLRYIADKKDFNAPSTIDDIGIIDEIRETFKENNI